MREAREDPCVADGKSEEQKKMLFLKRKKRKRKVHFATSMDICHLKNAEVEPKHQKYTGRVVFRGDMVKDDSGAYAVFSQNKDREPRKRLL